MVVVHYEERLLEPCTQFWWDLYRDLPYVHRPDGYQNVNGPPIGPDYFVRHLQAGLSNQHPDHWHGAVTPESIFVATDRGAIEGLLVASIAAEREAGHILSAYVACEAHGREVARALLSAALSSFGARGLQSTVAAPAVGMSLEAHSPIHLALLDEGFAWHDNWQSPPDAGGYAHVRAWPAYGVFLGGSLEGFRVGPQIREHVQRLAADGVVVESIGAEAFRGLARADTGERLGACDGDVSFVALQGGRAIGWLWELKTWTDWAEGPNARVMGAAVPEVVPEWRRQGIGKVLYHLGIEECVRRGARAGWTGTAVCNPARMIYRSVGYNYWYHAYNVMSRRLDG